MTCSRRTFLQVSLTGGTTAFAGHACVRAVAAAAGGSATFDLARDTPTRYFDGEHCWCHARAGIVPGAGVDGRPRVVMTLNTMDLAGSDVFKAMYSLQTDDLGRSWSRPRQQQALAPAYEMQAGRRVPVAASDFWPRWHAKSRTLLGTGHTVVYTPEWRVAKVRPRHTVYAVYDRAADRWQQWRKLELPAEANLPKAGAGCTQRYDLPDGTILLPVYFSPDGRSRVAVMRCAFDGQHLKYLERGNELSVDDDSRGLHEPSLARLDETYYLTIRHDRRGYVTRSKDGLHFEPLREWTFDDGSELGNYNTQQHWVAHSAGLFLVYTRRGLNNDHVFRHRAPLLIAQVDPTKLHVLRRTEQVLVPQRGARLGNFGVTDVSPEETWVTVAEWMQPRGCEKFGSDGSIWIARLRWREPNRSFSA